MRAGSGDPSFAWEIQGEDAVLRVTSAGYLMWRPLQLELWDAKAKRWDVLPPPELAKEWEGSPTLDGPAQHVAYVYAAFADDILTGSKRSVSFSDALAGRETIEAIRLAAQDGVARSPSPTVQGRRWTPASLADPRTALRTRASRGSVSARMAARPRPPACTGRAGASGRTWITPETYP